MTEQIADDYVTRPSGKVLAWASIVLGVLTTPAPLLPLLSAQVPYAQWQLVYFFVLGVVTIAAGVAALKGRPWAFRLLLAVYAIQLVAYSSPSLNFDLMGPCSIALGFGYYEQRSLFTVNLVSVLACMMASYNLYTSQARPAGAS